MIAVSPTVRKRNRAVIIGAAACSRSVKYAAGSDREYAWRGCNFLGDVHLGKASGCCRVDSRGYFIEMQFHQRPLRRALALQGQCVVP